MFIYKFLTINKDVIEFTGKIMLDVENILKNIESIYESNTAFNVLKDFERVLDELDVYVYKNWQDGELVMGPEIDRHWITCAFMWPRDKMPDPMGGKRLLDYDCKVGYKKDSILTPRKIRSPDDIRPGTKKGKLDRKPIWIVEIQMPKKLLADIFQAMDQTEKYQTEPAVEQSIDTEAQDADQAVAAAPEAAPEEAL
jgi:hypothetical protein